MTRAGNLRPGYSVKRALGAGAGVGLSLGLCAAALCGCSPSSQDAAQPQMASPPPSPPGPEAARLLAQLPAPYDHGDLENGRLHVNLCRSCHTLVQGGPDMIGPNLYGIFGRKVASKPGYAYSDALKSKTWTWDAAHLDSWLKDPRSYVPGTKMTFYGLRDDKDRIDTIAYLKVVTSGGPM